MSPSDASVDLSGLSGFRITQCLVDSAFSLAMSHERKLALLRIESPFRLRLGQEWVFDPADQRSTLGPALGLFGMVILSAKVIRSGELELVLPGDGWLLAYAGRDYEAWTLSLPDKTLIVSGVDGKISVFRDTPP